MHNVAEAATVLSAMIAASAMASSAHAQATLSPETGTIVGYVVDSVRGGYLRDAIVSVAETNKRATTGSVGQFRIDGVPVGMRTVHISHPLLDTLGIAMHTPEKELRAGEALTFIVGVPSPSTIVATKCSADAVALGTAALMGVVTDADTGTPSDGAEVVVQWTDYQVGKTSIASKANRRAGRVNVDGTYLVCGIPDDLVTGVFALRGRDSTAAVSVAFDRRLAIQFQSLPVTSEVAASSVDNERPLPARGTAVVSGSVVDPSGKPLSGARVSIESDEVATISDTAGRFTLRGARAGTRLVTVRKLGFEPVELTVNLVSTRPESAVLRMTKTVRTLETVRVTALRDIGLQRVGFADRQRLASGRYYSPKEIESRNPLRLNYLLESAPMLRSGVGADGKRYINGRGSMPCLRYFIDGRLTAEFGPGELDMLPDSYLSTAELGAVEVYSKLTVPGEFMARSRSGQMCSVVVIWTKHKLGVR